MLDSERRLIGIVSDRDLWQAILARSLEAEPTDMARVLRGLRVNEVMSWGAVTVSPDDDLRRAAQIMHERHLGALPVADRGRIVGIVTATDVVNALIGAGERRARKGTAGR